jgi:hypothetical protein
MSDPVSTEFIKSPTDSNFIETLVIELLIYSVCVLNSSYFYPYTYDVWLIRYQNEVSTGVFSPQECDSTVQSIEINGWHWKSTWSSSIQRFLIDVGPQSNGSFVQSLLEQNLHGRGKFRFYGIINSDIVNVWQHWVKTTRFWLRLNVVSLMFCQQCCWGFVCYGMW